VFSTPGVVRNEATTGSSAGERPGHEQSNVTCALSSGTAMRLRSDAALVRHLEEKKIGDLFDVITVIDTVMTHVWQKPQNF